MHMRSTMQSHQLMLCMHAFLPQELLDSGYLMEVNRFSKFIHGMATLFPEMVGMRQPGRVGQQGRLCCSERQELLNSSYFIEVNRFSKRWWVGWGLGLRGRTSTASGACFGKKVGKVEALPAPAQLVLFCTRSALS